MSVRTDTVNLIINVNGNAAQNQLNELRKRAADLTFEMKNNLKKGTEEYIAAAAELKTVKADMSALKQEIGITALSQKELTAELNKLKALKGSMTPFTKEFKDMDAQIKAVESRLYDVRNGVTGLASVFSKVKDEVKQFGVLMLSYLGFQFITAQFQNIIKGAGALSDQLADLRRVAGLTAEEAVNLNSSLGKIDTRTSVSNLRDIAVIAGKLGVAKEDILGFTKATDQLVVSLGDELGNADEITTNLGKILNVFDGKITGDNITKLGNAFVELANTGAATGGFIADFDQRLSGIAKSAGIGLGALSGLGAGLEEMGSRVESSTTAIQKLIVNINSDLPKAAGIAGTSLNQFKGLLKVDPTEAILKYSEGLVKSKSSFAEVVASLKDAGEEGARVIETISKLGTGADKLRERIDLGKKSILENTAITEAFALKNQTLGAELDKLGKVFYSFVMSSGVTNFLKGAVESTVEFIKWLKDLPTFIEENRIAISAVVTAFLLYNKQLIISNALWLANKAAVVAGTIAQYAAAAATLAMRTATLSFAAAQALASGNITRARAAWELLTKAFKASPIGLIAAGVVALAIALDNAFNKMTNLQKAEQEYQKKAIENYSDQVNKVEQLKKALEDENVGLETKKKLYAELIQLNPAFAETLRLDAQGHLLGAQAIDEYIKALRKKGELESLQELSNEKNKDVLSAQSEIDMLTPKLKSGNYTAADLIKAGNADAKLKAAKEAKKYFDDKLAEIYRQGSPGGSNEFTLPGDTVVPGAIKEDPSVAARRAELTKAIADLKTKYELLNATDDAGQKANLALQKKYQAELDALDHKEQKKSKSGDYARMLKEAQEFYKQLQKLKEDAANASKSQDEKDVIALEQKYKALNDKAVEYFKKHLTDRNTFNAEEKILFEAFNQELAALQKKQFDQRSDEEYAQSLKASDDYFAEKKRQVERDYAEGKISQDDYEKSITQLQARAIKNRIQIATDYTTTVKKAAADVKTFTIAQEDLITQNLQKQKDLRIAILQNEAKARRDIRDMQINDPNTSPKQRNDLQKQNAADDKDAALAGLKERLKQAGLAHDDSAVAMTDEAVAIWDKFNATVKQSDLELKEAQIANQQWWANEALNITSSLFTALDNLDQRALQKDQVLNDAKKNNYKKQLDAKLLSQKQYDKKVADADAEMDKKKQAADLKSFKRKQAFAISEALIDGALAIEKTYVEMGGFPTALPFVIAMGVATLAQVAAIATQAPPTAADGNWFRKGKKHKDGGIHVEIEKDEAVMKADTMTDSNQYTVTGTPAQITSKLNSMHGGVSWAGGAMITPAFMDRPAQLNPNLPRIMEQGGIVRQMTPAKTKSNTQDDPELKGMIRELIDVTKDKADVLSAEISFKKFERDKKQYYNVKKSAGMSQ